MTRFEWQAVNVRSAMWEYPQPSRSFFEGIWLLTLDGVHSVAFVPAGPTSWPPALPVNSDAIASVREARELSLNGQFSVTPDDERAGTFRTFTVADGLRAEVYFCSTADYDAAVRELRDVAKRTSDVHVTVRLHELRATTLAKLLARIAQ